MSTPGVANPFASVDRRVGVRERAWGVLAASMLGGALVVGGCAEADWHVFVSSSYSKPVLIRISLDDASRAVLIEPQEEVDVIRLDWPSQPATVSVLDPATCAVIAEADLPRTSSIVTFGDPFDPTRFGRLAVDAWSDPVGAIAPETGACSGG